MSKPQIPSKHILLFVHLCNQAMARKLQLQSALEGDNENTLIALWNGDIRDPESQGSFVDDQTLCIIPEDHPCFISTPGFTDDMEFPRQYIKPFWIVHEHSGAIMYYGCHYLSLHSTEIVLHGEQAWVFSRYYVPHIPRSVILNEEETRSIVEAEVDKLRQDGITLGPLPIRLPDRIKNHRVLI